MRVAPGLLFSTTAGTTERSVGRYTDHVGAYLLVGTAAAAAAASAAISRAQQAFSVTGSVHAGNSDPCETPADVSLVEIRGAFIFTARSELRKVLFLAPSVCGFFVCV